MLNGFEMGYRLIYDVMDETSAGLRDSELVSPVRYWCKKTGCPAFIVIGSGRC